MKTLDFILIDYLKKETKLYWKIRKLLIILFYPKDPSAKICFWIRLGQYLYERKAFFFSRYIEVKIYKRYQCKINLNVKIGQGLCLPHPHGIVIGTGCELGDNVILYHNVTLGRKDRELEEYPIIGSGVTIYCNSTVLGKVKIEEGTIIACNSVVLKNTEKESIYAGIPAKKTSNVLKK